MTMKKRVEARTLRALRSCAALAALLVLLPAGPAVGQLQPPAYRDLELNGDFQMMVNGEKVPAAEIYATRTPPAILILSSALPAPVMVIPGIRRVETINLMKLAKRPDGSIDVLPQATLKPQGSFDMEDEDLVFMVEGQRVRLAPKPPLLGFHPAADLKQYSPLYVKRAEAYNPDSATLGLLKKESQPVEVRVFFGSWCPTCQRMVPNAVRLSDELAGSKIRFQFYGLPHGFKGEPEATKYGVEAVPTAIVFVDGQEAGRIEGNRWLQPEVALRDILKGTS